MFYSLFYFTIHVLTTVDSGLCLYIHISIENHLPIQGQKHELRCVCVLARVLVCCFVLLTRG